jgi:predicted nucleic acid-binding protein
LSYLIDTNIISELRRGDRCDPNVEAWYESVAENELFLSSLVLGEIRKGIERTRPKAPNKAAALEVWLEQIKEAFEGRILSIDSAAADLWGRMSANRTIPVIDGLLAASAASNGITLVTRNERDIAGLGAALLNPFRKRP